MFVPREMMKTPVIAKEGQMPPEPTECCDGCGRALQVTNPDDLFRRIFCDMKCRQSWERDQRRLKRQVVRRGKREGYGAAGSTS